MKKIVHSVLPFLFTCIALAACNQNTPKQAAEQFLSSTYRYDFETAKKVSTEKTKKMVDMYEQFAQNLPDSVKKKFGQIKYDIKSVKEDSATAYVTYTTSEYPQEQTLHLVKQKGKWLVEWTKENAQGDNSSQQNQSSQPDSTAIQPSQPDTAKAK